MPINNIQNKQQRNTPDLSWHEQWLLGRQPQLADNMYSVSGYYGMTPHDMWGNWEAYPELYRQLDNAKKYKEYEVGPYSWDPVGSLYSQANIANLTDPNLHGLADNDGKYIFYNTNSNIPTTESLKKHEITHALNSNINGHNIPQLNTIDNIMHARYGSDWIYDPDYSPERGGDYYYDNPDEIYARLMSTRYSAGLNPQDIITKERLQEMRDGNNVQDYDKDNLLNRYDDDTLLRLFNEVAQNNTDDNMVNYAANGGSIHIDPKNRGKFNATKKRTGKTTEELTHSKNPLTRKRAIFAQNAKKWKHDDGGYLQDEEPKTKWWQDLLIGGVNLANNYLGRGNEYAEGGNLFLNNNNMKHKFADGGGPTDPPYIENQYNIPENVKYGDTSNYITNTHEFDSSGWEEKDGEKWVRSPERTILESRYIPEVQVRAPYKDSKDRYIGQVADYLAQQKSTGVNSNYERLLHIVKQAYQDPENLNEDGSFNQRGFAQMAQMQHFGPGSYYQMGESQLHRNQDNYDYMDRLKRYYPDSNAKDTYYWNLITRPEDWDKTFPEYFLDDKYVRKHDNGGNLINNNINSNSMNRNYFDYGGGPTDPPSKSTRRIYDFELPVTITGNVENTSQYQDDLRQLMYLESNDWSDKSDATKQAISNEIQELRSKLADRSNYSQMSDVQREIEDSYQPGDWFRTSNNNIANFVIDTPVIKPSIADNIHMQKREEARDRARQAALAQEAYQNSVLGNVSKDKGTYEPRNYSYMTPEYFYPQYNNNYVPQGPDPVYDSVWNSNGIPLVYYTDNEYQQLSPVSYREGAINPRVMYKAYGGNINNAMREYFMRKRACGGNLYAEGGEVDPAMMQGGEVPPEAGGMPPEMMGAPTPQGGMPVPQEGTPMPEQGGMPVEAGMPPQEGYPEEEMPEEEEEGQDEWEEGFWEARDEAMAEGKKTFEYDGKVYPTDLGARNIKKKSKKKKYGGSLKVPKEILPY